MTATRPILKVTDLDVGFDGRAVLTGVDVAVEPKSVFVLMGPGGAGKSTFVRAVTGSLDRDAAEITGSIDYSGEMENPSFVRQNPRQVLETVYEFLASAHPARSEFTRSEFRAKLEAYLQERQLDHLVEELDRRVLDQSPQEMALLRLVRAALERRSLVCLDEPTSTLPEEERQPLIDFVRRESQDRAFLFVTHNQRVGRKVGDRVALLAGGRIIENRVVSEFFDSPNSEVAKQYLRTGSCSVTSPEIAIRPNGNEHGSSSPDISDSSDSTEPGERTESRQITYRHPSEVRGPQGFRWLVGGRLGGSPIPGAACPVEHDLRALERVGVTLLVTLTEEALPEGALEEVGFDNIHFPIVDMKAPDIEAAAELCEHVANWMQNGGVVVFHCRAGMGRAGTMLCSMLVWSGHAADCALNWARTIYEKWVQSREQERFLESLEGWLGENQPERQGRIFSGDLAPHYCSCNCPPKCTEGVVNV